MNKKTLDSIKEKLIQEKERLARELARFSKKFGNPEDEEYNVMFPDFGDKEDENASEVAQYSTNLTLEKKLHGELRDVELALKRIQEGTYGACKYCGKQIDEKRLLIRPESSACIDCKKSFKGENMK